MDSLISFGWDEGIHRDIKVDKLEGKTQICTGIEKLNKISNLFQYSQKKILKTSEILKFVMKNERIVRRRS